MQLGGGVSGNLAENKNHAQQRTHTRRVSRAPTGGAAVNESTPGQGTQGGQGQRTGGEDDFDEAPLEQPLHEALPPGQAARVVGGHPCLQRLHEILRSLAHTPHLTTKK